MNWIACLLMCAAVVAFLLAAFLVRRKWAGWLPLGLALFAAAFVIQFVWGAARAVSVH